METPATKIYVVEPTDDDHFHWWEMGRKQGSDPFPPVDTLPAKLLTEQIARNRHSDGANYLYADWHVKWGRFSQLWGTTQETNAFWP